MQIFTAFRLQTGVGSRAKNREIKWEELYKTLIELIHADFVPHSVKNRNMSWRSLWKRALSEWTV